MSMTISKNIVEDNKKRLMQCGRGSEVEVVVGRTSQQI